MSLYQLKPQFQALLRPIASLLAQRNISANQVTIFTIGFCCVFSAFLYIQGASPWWLLLPFVLFIRMALNAIDGLMANEFTQTSKLGAVLNEVGDLISDAAICFALLSVIGFDSAWLVIFVLLAWLTEFVAILAAQLVGKRANHGPLGKSDRTLLIGLISLVIGFGFDVSLFAVSILVFANALLVLTFIRRVTFICRGNHL